MTVPFTADADARRLLSSTEAAHHLGLQTISDLDMWCARHGVHAVEGPTGTLRWRRGDLDRALSPNVFKGVPESALENGDGVVLILLGALALVAVGAAWVIWKWTT